MRDLNAWRTSVNVVYEHGIEPHATVFDKSAHKTVQSATQLSYQWQSLDRA